jgi:hypothetical protein
MHAIPVTSPHHVREAAANATAHLVLNYRPVQPHGWPPAGPEPVAATIGGHTSAKDFTHNGRSYRVGLLPFGQPGDAQDPVYEAVPADSTVNFKQTLTGGFTSIDGSPTFNFYSANPGLLLADQLPGDRSSRIARDPHQQRPDRILLTLG